MTDYGEYTELKAASLVLQFYGSYTRHRRAFSNPDEFSFMIQPSVPRFGKCPQIETCEKIEKIVLTCGTGT